MLSRQPIDLLRPRIIGQSSKLRPQLLEPFSSQWGLNFDGISKNYIGLGTTMPPTLFSTIVMRLVFNSGNWRAAISFDITARHVVQISTAGQILYGNLAAGSPRISSPIGAIQSGSVSDLVIVRNGLTLINAKLYLNAIDIPVSAGAGNFNPPWTNGRIGTRVDNFFPWLGIISEVLIYNRSFSAEEIRRHHENPQLQPDMRGLVGWWRFQEGFGVADGTVIRDWSGQGKHGSMQNFSGDPWVNVGIR